MSLYCGIDFGTSNSAVCVGDGADLRLVPIEGDAVTLPSAVFFNFETETVSIGREAIAQYLDGYEGRLMRALKSILGSSLIKETTQIGSGRKDFRAIIGLYIAELKRRADAFAGSPITEVVLGRPVHFVDGDPDADARAEAELRGIAQAQGFKTISFEFEPLAAARDYAEGLNREDIVLVVDIGGGTSDFSVLRLGPGTREILANAGVHIGGTDFDTRLSLDTAMRDLGFRGKYKTGLEFPTQPYFQLATWHLINFLYTQKSMTSLRQIHYLSGEREKTGRLLEVIEKQAGHDIANRIEKAKIALSDASTTIADFTAIDPDWRLEISRDTLTASVEKDVSKVVAVALETVTTRAGLEADAVQTLFMTGGSTALPGFEAAMQAAFPKARMTYGDRFSSVASGLGLAARERHSST
ncbi:Hsp70 family protein [Asticcacaulis sp. 201]|uniref:Hsp70 family protein n=1 Tax=Asticcacaulis sp. 201 TaxID=3028787 RepID=UPI002916040B|nr:Hsp70 family protein [Asticcacaulis sp. 201]MDV6332613.1 Hsp70 family protein [Asticcacaulis sp. 201]